MHYWMKGFLGTLFALSTFSSLASQCIETRAGIDMGSGTTKIQVAQVDICQHQLGKVLYEDQRPLGFNDDLGKSGNNHISEAMQQQGVTALKEMVDKARTFHPQRITGVATAVFRSAANGQQVIDRFNQQTHIQLRVISQEQEAELGFLSAKAALHDNTIKNQDLLVWDIGGGSMQMTALREQNGQPVTDIYQGRLASVTLKEFIISVLKNQALDKAASPNPIGSLRNTVLRYVNFYARTHVSPQIKQDAQTRRVIGIGGVHGFSLKDQLHPKDNTYTLADVERVSKNQVWKGDSELTGEYRATDVSNLLLVEGFMQALNIPQVTIVKASLIQGILVQ
ncbi:MULTISPECIES: Ppx/GppA phosphatase family protein [Rahnella]|jgi:exopolyphosphatase/guanosine-5'-triphosphate,3'-diphosphate pyrophosphatase|uniref:Phosphatase n=1 Tax=Rahnella victoriana TaxID=1510570 RepID=A0ABS0DLN5_9GAMM|nr:phosphatase [Rahnella]VTQ53972.1 fumarate reductase [Campylobacter jejuni]MBF7954809.1 phosphatase [Rahnella victoriana]TBX37452.1 phosphatase [Rahnella victoriana]TDS96902.1 exopolyphosphatase/guanosine-5'-triphosphate,3'-diphosphate pyrophosphatase [Rahnella sp. BIGb0236]UHM91138.1 phosphatase [Rahnella victoriana]